MATYCPNCGSSNIGQCEHIFPSGNRCQAMACRICTCHVNDESEQRDDYAGEMII